MSDDELAQVLGELWQEGARHIYLDGGEVVRQGLQAGLVDELTLFWVPVTLGRGVSLFAGTLPGRLTPVSSVVLPSAGTTKLPLHVSVWPLAHGLPIGPPL